MKESAVFGEGVRLQKKVSQAVRKVWNPASSVTVPIPSDTFTDYVSESHFERAAEAGTELSDRAIQATRKVLDNWSQNRFMSLTSEFSSQMKEYWTPELQERVYRSLGNRSRALGDLGTLEWRQLPGPCGHAVLRCHITWTDSQVSAEVRIVMRWDGVIAAFYIWLTQERLRLPTNRKGVREKLAKGLDKPPDVISYPPGP